MVYEFVGVLGLEKSINPVLLVLRDAGYTYHPGAPKTTHDLLMEFVLSSL